MKISLLLLLLFLITPQILQAQDQQLIEVEGKSEIKVLPNEALIHVHLQEKALKASTAAQNLNQTSDTIVDRLKQKGMASYEVTASNYMVTVNRIYGKENVQDSGYVATQTLVIRIGDIQKSLYQAMEVLGDFPALNYTVGFQLSDELRKSKQEALMVQALEDAQAKAKLIAVSLGLGEVVVHKVTYSSQHQHFPAPIISLRGNMVKEQSVPPTFLPEVQTLTDTILVSFRF